jgi:hypothetical protein
MKSVAGTDFFLIPPGPSPFPDRIIEKTINALSGDGKASDIISATGEQTTIRFGGIMTLERMVTTDARVTWDMRCDDRGIPLAADLQMDFQTNESLTKEALYDAMLGVQK